MTFVQSYINKHGIRYDVSRSPKGYNAMILPMRDSGKQTMFVGYFDSLSQVKQFCENITSEQMRNINEPRTVS